MPSKKAALSYDVTKEKGKSKKRTARVTFPVIRRIANATHVARLCISHLKHQVSKAKWSIVAAEDGAEVDNAKAEVLTELFRRPNVHDNFRTLMDKVLEDVLVLDAGCVEITGDRESGLSLYHVDGATVRPYYDEHGFLGDPAYGQFMPTNDSTPVAEWSEDEVMYIMQNPQADVDHFGYGMSPLEAVIVVATNILNADNFMGQFFDVGTLPPVLISLGADITQEELDKFREYWKAEIEGKPWKTAFFGGTEKIQVEKLNNGSPADMQFEKYQNWLMKMMCAAYEVSPQDIGFTQEQGLNRATAEVQQEISQGRGLASLTQLIEETFNERIIQRLFGWHDVKFQFDKGETTDPEKAARVFQIEAAVGARSINEYRNEVGLDPIPGCDKPFIMTAQGPYFVGEEPKQPEQPAEEQKPEVKEPAEPKEEVQKMVYSDVFQCYLDDRGHGQPFIWVNTQSNRGFVIKPPVAVAEEGKFTEIRLTKEMSELGLNVKPVIEVSKDQVLAYLPSEGVKQEFFEWQHCMPEYDSEKWKAKYGVNRLFDTYLVSEFIPGMHLNSDAVMMDMKHRPEAYLQAARDLGQLVSFEARHVLGDRRADQYIITPSLRAYGFDYQFEGDEKRWKKTKDAVSDILSEVPELLDAFNEAKDGFKKFNEEQPRDSGGRFSSGLSADVTAPSAEGFHQFLSGDKEDQLDYDEEYTVKIGKDFYRVQIEGWFPDCMESRSLGETTPEKIDSKFKEIMEKETGMKADISGYIKDYKDTEFGATYIGQKIVEAKKSHDKRNELGQYHNVKEVQEKTRQNMPRMKALHPAVEMVKVSSLNKIRTKPYTGVSGELMMSMKADGFNKPVEVRLTEDGKPYLHDGHHRIDCAKELGITQVPAVLVDNMEAKSPKEVV